MAVLPTHVTIVEVGARDGLQNEAQVTTADKIHFINNLSKTGLKHIEAGAFVSPKWVPQMADSLSVITQIDRSSGVIYSALTPNKQGFELAIQSGVEQVAIFGSASEGFSQHNINCSVSESLKRFEPVMVLAKQYNIPVRGYLSCVVECPYDGPTPPEKVTSVANELINLGCYEVSLGDTIGTGTPLQIATMLESVNQKKYPSTNSLCTSMIPGDRHLPIFTKHSAWGSVSSIVAQPVLGAVLMPMVLAETSQQKMSSTFARV